MKTLHATQVLAPTAAGTNTPITLSTSVASPHLWDGVADPYLYSVRTVVSEGGVARDSLVQPLGFRFYSIDPNTGFSLNGRHVDLHGVNRHQEWGGLGWALTNKEHDTDMALIKEMGANLIRGCHYPHAQYWYDLADRNGMLFWAEVGLSGNGPTSTAFNDNAVQQNREHIRQSYNHPSIVVWSLENETPGDDPLIAMLDQVVHAEDPSRLTTLAYAGGAWDTLSLTPDVVGFNLYYGWYYGAVTDLGPKLDGLHQQQPARPFALSEYGAGASIRFHSDTPKQMDHTEEWQALVHEGAWAALSTRPFVWGKMIWAMFDFASSTRNEGDTPGINDKGLVTHDHQTRKDAFYYYKANWTTDPFVWITSRRFEPRTQPTTDIKVYANTDSVEVKVNGMSLGSKTSADHIFVWPAVTLNTGSNQVDAVGSKGGVSTYTDSVTWTVQ